MEEVFLDLAQRSETNFRLGEIVAPAVSAMRSPDVARDILSLGCITMNVAAPGLFDQVEATDGAPLMATVLDYALEVAPRADGEEHVIDVAALGQHVKFMRDTFGDVEISNELITRIGHFAQVRINLEQLAARPAPETQGETA
jgi:hypothetical protein